MKKCKNYASKPECNYCNMRGRDYLNELKNCYVPRPKNGLEKKMEDLK